MAAYFNSKVVDDIEQLAVISALRECGVEHNKLDEPHRLLQQLLDAAPNIHSLLAEFISLYRSWALFCEEIETEGNGGKLQTGAQNDQYFKLKANCEKSRIAFIQALSQ